MFSFNQLTKKNNILHNIIFIIMLSISLSVTGYSAYNLFKLWYNQKYAAVVYDDITEQIYNTDVKDIVDRSYIPQASEELSEETTINATEKDEINWQTLTDINIDSIGILYIPQLGINLPVVQGTDNQHYLHYSIDGSYSSCGTLFEDCRISSGADGKNIIIYGHNMHNGSMFGKLAKYLDESFFYKYDTLYFLCGNDVRAYKVFSVYTTENGSDTYTCKFSNDLNFINYKENIKKLSKFDSDVDVNNTAQVITLSTCYSSGSTTRTIVHAQRIN